jgi:hypothetical protein
MRSDPVAEPDTSGHQEKLRTSCGREVTVGRLALGDVRHPAARVFVDLGQCAGCEGTGWAGLTVAEARRLARAVLAQAAAAEQECHVPGEAGAFCGPAEPA